MSRRARAVASAALCAVAATLLVVFVPVSVSMWRSAQRLGDGLSVVAYLPLGVSPEATQIEEISRDLERIGGVERVLYISREESLARLRKALGDDVMVLDDLNENPLPASFELRLAAESRSPEQVKAIAAQAKGQPWIDDVQYGEEWLDAYEKVFATLRRTAWAGFGFAALLLTAGIALGVDSMRGSKD